MSSWRQGELGNRSVRVANCSGYHGDPPIEMYKQATLGDVDFITGDYLAEVNIAKNAELFAAGEHPGYEETAWEGLEQTIDVIHSKQIKVAINGGALNPKGLAEKVAKLIHERNLNLKVAYVAGDELLPEVGSSMPTGKEEAYPHIDSNNPRVRPFPETFAFLGDDSEPREIVSANAYLGARGIVEGFRRGADIVIAGRVSDASPVIAAAWYWFSWNDGDYDRLAGSLIAGHLIECSAYVTGGNFAGFTEYDQSMFIDPGFPIAEISDDGSCVITKHPGTGGIVNVDTVRCQLLYELQGNVYLHSDSKAVLDNVEVEQSGEDRVRVRGVRGLPPPPTTKLAIFYKGGYEAQLLFNTAGYASLQKCELFEKQIRYFMGKDALQNLDVLQFQRIGMPETDPSNQNSSTIYIRIFAQAKTAEALTEISKAVGRISVKHYHGFHCSLDMRSAIPRPYLAYYPAIWAQNKLEERVHFISTNGEVVRSYPVGHPPKYEDLVTRDNYDTVFAASFAGPTKTIRLGDIALARSGDKGSNLNFGIFVRTTKEWEWLRSYMSRDRMWALLGNDADPSYSIERVEFPRIFAVHFVIYGILGRGVSSSTRLDCFAKGFADYVRDKLVEVPEEVLR